MGTGTAYQFLLYLPKKCSCRRADRGHVPSEEIGQIESRPALQGCLVVRKWCEGTEEWYEGEKVPRYPWCQDPTNAQVFE